MRKFLGFLRLIIGLLFILYYIVDAFSPIFSSILYALLNIHVDFEITNIGFLQHTFSIFLLGLGIALTVYNVFGRRGCFWFSVFLATLTLVGYIIGGVNPGEFIPKGYWGIPTLTSFVAIPFLLLFYSMKMNKKWFVLIGVVTILLFFMIMAITIYGEYIFYTVRDPYDTVERDEAAVRRGYTYCGEFILEPRTGLQRVSWNKTFRGNESVACYFKVMLPPGSKLGYAVSKFNATIKKPDYPTFDSINGTFKKIGEFGFYYSYSICLNRECLEKGERFFIDPFYRYASSTTSGVSTISEFAVPFYRYDVLISYKPGIIEPGEEAIVDVRWDLEIDILFFF